MSREADYLVFAAEQYRYAKGLTGAQLVELFEKYGVSKFIMDSYELFHIESEQNMIAAVDELIERQTTGGRQRINARHDGEMKMHSRFLLLESLASLL